MNISHENSSAESSSRQSIGINAATPWKRRVSSIVLTSSNFTRITLVLFLRIDSKKKGTNMPSIEQIRNNGSLIRLRSVLRDRAISPLTPCGLSNCPILLICFLSIISSNSVQTTYVGSQIIQATVNILITSIDLSNIVYTAGAFSAHCCNQQSYAGANIG